MSTIAFKKVGGSIPSNTKIPPVKKQNSATKGFRKNFQARFPTTRIPTKKRDWEAYTHSPKKKSTKATTFPRTQSSSPEKIQRKRSVSPIAVPSSALKAAPQTQETAKPESKSTVRPFHAFQDSAASTTAAPLVKRDSSTLVSPLPRFNYFDESLMSCLCLVPLLVSLKEPQKGAKALTTCYWPSLVFQSLSQASVWYKKLYPKQGKIHKRIKKKLTLAALEGREDDSRTIVFPLGNSEGCCPKDLCERPLYDCIDITTNASAGNGYWRTISKAKGKVIEGGHKVIQIWQNFNELGQCLAELRQQIPTIGPDLKEALNEMERLANLYDEDSDEDSDDDEDEHDETTPFVPSLVKSEEQPQSILFPESKLRLLNTKSKSKKSKREDSTPVALSTPATGAIQFPVSTQKPPETEKDATTMVRAQTTASALVNDQGRVGFQPWTSPELQQTKRARLEVETNQNTTSNPAATTITAADARTPKATKRPSTPSSSVSSTRSSRKKPTVIDSGDRIEVSAWSEIKPLLQKLGHVFYEVEQTGTNSPGMLQFYCRPNGDPQRYATAVLDKDYFHTMDAYRRHLCANGVEFCGRNGKALLSDDDLELIAYWVRFSVFTQRVTGGRKTERIPDLEFTGPKGLQIRLLRKIGYKYSSNLLLEGYLVPDDKGKYLSELELWEHLGKHGLSPLCDLSQLTMEELIALEIQIIRKYHGNYGDQAFRCVRKLKGKTKRVAGLPTPMAEYTPAANKDALQECTRGPDSAQHDSRIMSPRKLMSEDVTPKPPKRSPRRSANDDSQSSKNRNEEIEPQHAKPSARRSIQLVENAETSQKQDRSTTSSQIKEKAATSEASVQSTKIAARAKRLLVEETVIEEVEIPGENVEEKLKACQRFLRKNEIVARGNLANNMGVIRSFVDTVIETKGRVREGNRPPILYICGRPGTGKTMSTTKLCEAAIDAKIASNEEWEKAPRMCHISCPAVVMNSNYHDGMNKIMDRLEMKPKQLKRSPNDEKNAATIIILDEVDQLLGKKSTESILQQLCSWAKDQKNVLSIIGISNAVGNDKVVRMREYGMGDMWTKLVFQTYTKEDLVKLSQAKIGFSVVHQKAHEFIAAKVANSSGDARQYLDLVQKAIIFSRRMLKLEQLSAELSKPCVTIRNAMEAIRETNQKCKETIQSLTSYEKMTLCAGVHLARKLGGKPVPMGKLRTLVMSALGMDADVSLEEFKGIIERLQDSGLLKLQEREKQAFTKMPMLGLLRYPVQFDLQLEDVDSALENTLMKEDFYKRMVDRLQGIPGL